MTAAPTNELPLSIIVISFNPQPILERCLAALSPQIESGENELLVIGRWPDTALLSDLRTHYPNAVFIEAPLQETIPQMRLRGIAEAQGRLIALLEDGLAPDHQPSLRCNRQRPAFQRTSEPPTAA